MKEETFVEQDMQYHSGVCLDEYNDEISICSAQRGNDKKVYLKWGYPQNKDRKPSEKSLPWKVGLSSKSQAIETLELFIRELKGTKQPDQAANSDAIPF